MKWTAEQTQAIYEKGSNILVAAAAGSGKTAVLVERIINKIINENVDIDKLLVVTFTNAAASEMRERVLDAIYKKLEEEPNNNNLQRQLTLINKASICTIDSFCLDVIKNNFYEIDISPNFRIGDTVEISLLKQETLEELFESKYEEENKDFIKLINTYTGYRDDTPLKELVLKIYDYTQSNPFPQRWLEEKVEMFNLKEDLNKDFAKTVWGKLLLQELEEELIDNITQLQNAKMILSKYPELDKFEKTIDNDIERLQDLKSSLNSWDLAYEKANNLTFTKWPVDKKLTFEEKEIAKSIRDSVKKKLKKKTDKILVFNSYEANQDINDMYEILVKLKNFIFEFDNNFTKKKRLKNLIDFNDIEHLALKILLKQDEKGNIVPTEVAKKYQEKFCEIAVDEYQDSNLVQEYILTSIQKNNNIFMVGDVKQSIYRFRQARPELFLEKYSTYKLKENKQEKDNLKIQLFKNFRSRENILAITNLIFENIMSNLLGDIEYNKEEYLNLGADYQKTSQDLKTEIDIINLKDKKEDDWEQIDTARDSTSEGEDSQTEEDFVIIESAEIEAKFVANKIKNIINSGYKVYNTKKQEFSNIQYKDIVILLRSTKDVAPIFEKELIANGIPVFCDASSEYLDSIEIQTIMSILKIVDNPLNDIPLVTCLRSPIGGFTDNDLVQIRLADKYDNFYKAMLKAKLSVDKPLREKIERFLEKIDQWRKEQEYLSLDELIWKIYTETGYYNYVGLMPNGALRQANLKMLFERAKQYETASFKGLFNFIKFIERLQLSSGDMSAAKLIGENENVVRIMSIHKSKGLEFPMVFLSNVGKQFNLMDLNNNVLLHQDIGLGVKYIDYDKQIEYDTLSKAAIKNRMLVDTLAEEMRILYVAISRAKEKLIITGTSKDYEKEFSKISSIADNYKKENNKIHPILVKRFKRYIDWIILVMLYNKEEFSKLAQLNVYDKCEVLKNKDTQQQEEIDVIKLLDKEKTDEKQVEKIKNLLEYKYPYTISTKIPTKTSVTAIKQMKQARSKLGTQNEDLNIAKFNADNNEDKNQSLTFTRPKFLNDTKEEKITSAHRGTLVHLCLQKLDETKTYTKQDISNLIQELQAKKIITEQEAKAISVNKIFNFTKSYIWQELKQAKKIEKEKPFYINIPAKEIYEEETEENVLVQGVIDLYYIDKDDNLILVDYKTDYVENGKEAELIEKYKDQLNLYQTALEQAFKKKVYKKYIYSVYLDKAIEIEQISKI